METEKTIDMVMFPLSISRGLRHRIKIKSAMQSEERGEFISMTALITEVLEKYLQEIPEP